MKPTGLLQLRTLSRHGSAEYEPSGLSKQAARLTHLYTCWLHCNHMTQNSLTLRVLEWCLGISYFSFDCSLAFPARNNPSTWAVWVHPSGPSTELGRMTGKLLLLACLVLPSSWMEGFVMYISGVAKKTKSCFSWHAAERTFLTSLPSNDCRCPKEHSEGNIFPQAWIDYSISLNCKLFYS